MINFQYQILRYRPDFVTGEFVNIGIILYEKESRRMKWTFIKNPIRVLSFFPNFPINGLAKEIEYLDSSFQEVASRLKQNNFIPDSIAEITKSKIGTSDTSIFLSDTKNATDFSLDKAFANLTERLLSRHEPKMFMSASVASLQSLHSFYSVKQAVSPTGHVIIKELEVKSVQKVQDVELVGKAPKVSGGNTKQPKDQLWAA